MRRFRDLSIRSKLMTGFMLTSLAALLLTVGALTWYDRATFRDEVLRDVDTLAGILGENASSSVAFNDHRQAEATLAALRAQPQITGAAIYDSKGALFATYVRAKNGDKPGPLPQDGTWIDAQHIGVARPILFSGARVGTLTVRSDLSEMAVRRARTLQIAGGIYIAAAFVALLLASVFQRAISRPIHRLLRAEKRVSREKDYTLRVEKEADDEIGLLIDGFNEMLGEIRARDAEILAQTRSGDGAGALDPDFGSAAHVRAARLRHLRRHAAGRGGRRRFLRVPAHERRRVDRRRRRHRPRRHFGPHHDDGPIDVHDALRAERPLPVAGEIRLAAQPRHVLQPQAPRSGEVHDHGRGAPRGRRAHRLRRRAHRPADLSRCERNDRAVCRPTASGSASATTSSTSRPIAASR